MTKTEKKVRKAIEETLAAEDMAIPCPRAWLILPVMKKAFPYLMERYLAAQTKTVRKALVFRENILDQYIKENVGKTRANIFYIKKGLGGGIGKWSALSEEEKKQKEDQYAAWDKAAKDRAELNAKQDDWIERWSFASQG